MFRPSGRKEGTPCRPPRGGRGLKYEVGGRRLVVLRRPPRGGRGLKFNPRADLRQHALSPSSRRAWIEISSPAVAAQFWKVALLAEGVD